MKHKWVALVIMQPEIYCQFFQFFYPSEPLTLDHIIMRHPVVNDSASLHRLIIRVSQSMGSEPFWRRKYSKYFLGQIKTKNFSWNVRHIHIYILGYIDSIATSKIFWPILWSTYLPNGSQIILFGNAKSHKLSENDHIFLKNLLITILSIACQKNCLVWKKKRNRFLYENPP